MQQISNLDKRGVLQQEYSPPPILPPPHSSLLTPGDLGQMVHSEPLGPHTDRLPVCVTHGHLTRSKPILGNCHMTQLSRGTCGAYFLNYIQTLHTYIALPFCKTIMKVMHYVIKIHISPPQSCLCFEGKYAASSVLRQARIPESTLGLITLNKVEQIV